MHTVMRAAGPHFTASQALHNTATPAAAAVLLGVIVVAYRLARRHHSPVPFFFLLGGALTVGYEPVVDTLGKCYLPSDYQWTMFTVLDRPMPVYAVLVYTAFFGGFAILSWNHLTTGRPATGLWKKFAAAILVNTFLFETPAVLRPGQPSQAQGASPVRTFDDLHPDDRAGAITIGLAVLIMRGVIGGLEVIRQRDGQRPEGLAIPGLSSGRR
jgi:hypothetical protein